MKAKYSPELEAALRDMAYADPVERPRVYRIFNTIVRDNICETAVWWPPRKAFSTLLEIARKKGLYIRKFYEII